MIIGDLVVIIAIALTLLWAAVVLLRGGKPQGAKQLWLAVIAASGALLLRFIISFFPEAYIGKVPTEVLLAVAAGAIASGFLGWMQRPSRASEETSAYEVTYTFRDGPSSGQLLMTYRALHDRTNLTHKTMLGWTNAAFEPYLWTDGVKQVKLQCSSSAAAFTTAVPNPPPQSIPHTLNGFALELNETDPAHTVARIAPGEQKWFLLEAQVQVPSTYWDVAAGSTTLGRPPKFTMRDETRSKNLVFVIAGPGPEYNTNLDTGGKRSSDEVVFASDEVPRRGQRAQVYWYPLNTLDPKAADILKQRFARTNRWP